MAKPNRGPIWSRILHRYPHSRSIAPIAPDPTVTVSCEVIWLNTQAEADQDAVYTREYSWRMPLNVAKGWTDQLIENRHAVREDLVTGLSIAEFKLQYPAHPWIELSCNIEIQED